MSAAWSNVMSTRTIYLIDPDARYYDWPFKLGVRVWSKTHHMLATIVGGWFELRTLTAKSGLGSRTAGSWANQIFYRVETEDGREFTEPAQDLEAR